MKVQYIKLHTDEFNDTFECGWVAEHTDAEAERRIALGVCVAVSPDTKALKYQKGAKLLTEECATEPEPSAPMAPAAAPVVKSK